MTGEELVTEVSRRWSRTLPAVTHQQLVAMNARAHPWRGFLEAEPFLDFDAWGERWLSTPDGAPVPFQRVQPEAPIMLANRLLFPVTVPAGGVTQLLVRGDAGPPPVLETDLKASEAQLSNSHVQLELAGCDLAMVTHDAYSLSLQGGCWQWTLLRSPIMAWGGGKPEIDAGRTHPTDQGPHRFDFVLWPGEALTVGALETAASQAAHPPVVFDRYEGMRRPPWGNNVPKPLWTGAEQRARQDGRMTHLQDGDEGVEE